MLTTLTIDGMRSVHCVRAVFTALGGVPGVVRADVSMGSARLEHEREVDERAIAEALAAIGYDLRAMSVERRRLAIRDDAVNESTLDENETREGVNGHPRANRRLSDYNENQ